RGGRQAGARPRLEHLFDVAAQAVARAADVHAAELLGVEADLAAHRRVVVSPEEAHLLVGGLAELHARVRRVRPRAFEVEAAAGGDLELGWCRRVGLVPLEW